ncbi:MAG: universal stress protein [Euryarchaeota archaeon]|nr:universal stress protein [Euryarchaeota archaeon]
MTARTSTITEVLLPIEGGSEELIAQDQAVEVAANLEVPLRILHVSTEDDEVPGDVFDHVQDLCRRRHVDATVQTLRGPDVVQEIVDEARPSDVIVIGTRRLGSRYHLGSITEGLVHRAPCPVHVVRLGEAAARPNAGRGVPAVVGGRE